MMKKIFITAHFRKEWNHSFLIRLEDALSKLGYDCYLPQRDTTQNNPDKYLTYKQDYEGVIEADLLLAMGHNLQSPNWGFEIGLAVGREIPVIILVDKDDDVALMPKYAASEVYYADSIDDLDEYLERLEKLIKKLL